MVSVTPEITLRGTPLSPGIALGKACFYWQAARHPDNAVASTENQTTRLQNLVAPELRLGGAELAERNPNSSPEPRIPASGRHYTSL